MRALVTGASGFVGAAVVRALLARGFQVRALVRASSNRANLHGLDVEAVIGDLTDAQSLRAALAGCQALFHVAADYRLWTPQPELLYRSNVEGTRNILQAARDSGVQRTVYTSSVATLALRCDGTPSDESDMATLGDMIGHYKRSKFLAEEVAREAVRAGQDVVIVNPSTPIGPGDVKPTPTGQLILDAATGRMPAYVDTGLNMVHVDDVAQGHLLAYERGQRGERYVLGGWDLHLKTILALISQITGRRAPRVRLPHAVLLPMAVVAEGVARLTGRPTRITLDSVRMARHYMYFSSSKAIRELGYERRDARAALQDAVRWFLDARR